MRNQIIVCENHQEIGDVVATIFAESTTTKPNCVWGLATGASPIPVYKKLCDFYEAEDLDCSQVTTFNLDEYAGRGPGDPDSYYEFMHQHLFDKIPFKKNYLPDAKHSTELDELNESGIRYDAIIDKVGGIDIMLVGIGTNGHIAFNEPSDIISKGTQGVILTEQTRHDNALKFYDGNIDAVPKYALSMGMMSILQSNKIVLIANGPAKALAIRNALYGPITPKCPASLLQLHPNVTFVVDEAAYSLCK